MARPTPHREVLAAQVRWAMGRGLPAQVAEDLVFEAWEAATAGHDPARGTFEAYLQTIVRNRCAYWWREQARDQRAVAQLRLVAPPPSSAREERASRNQDALLAALETEERAIFAAWALQKHLGKGQVTSVDISRTLGLEVSEYENAKRRLRAHLQALLDRFGWSVSDLLFGGEDVDQTG